MNPIAWIGRTLRRSVLITQITLRITFKQDPELLLFPALTLLFVLCGSGGAYALAATTAHATGLLPIQPPLIGLAAAALLLPLALTFSTFCTTRTVQVRLHGGDASLWHSLGFGLRNLPRIILWQLVSTGAWLVLGSLRRALHTLADNLGPLGALLEGPILWLFETAWRISRLLAIPAMVYESVGPIDGIKSSVSLIRETWGQSLIRDLGFSALFGAFKVAIAAILLATVFLLPPGSTFQLVALGLAALAFVLTYVIESMLASVFNAAMYHFATRGEAGLGFSKEILQSAMRRKGAR